VRPYPARLVRYPAGVALAFVPARKSKRRGPGLFASVRHPIAVLVVIMVLAGVALIPLAWLAAVTAVWASWVMCVTIGWLCALPFPQRRQVPAPMARAPWLEQPSKN
jgi:endonuclease/exonuclease/phosphatase (EEP) superfamily protein YafD